MTNDRRRAPRIDLSGLEWKLAVVAALAGSYVALWLGLRAPARAPAELAPPPGWTVATGEGRAAATPPRAVRPRRLKTRSS